jgi:hypothetical protein
MGRSLRDKILEKVRIKQEEELAKLEEEKRRTEMKALAMKGTRKKK